MHQKTLLLSNANTKLKKLEKRLNKKIYSIDLISGWSCPFAKICKSKVVGDQYGLHIQDGKYTKFRCYSASQEALYTHVFMRRLKNYQILKSIEKSIKKLVCCISSSIPSDADIIRYHVAGDFFCKNYMRAAIEVANKHPNTIFYSYTKAIAYFNDLMDNMPPNFRLVASYGGMQDYDINDKMTTATVFKTKEDVTEGLEIDHDDYHAYLPQKNFALLIHGIQPKGIK
jgi:hypothetical protein